jgi:hypothetical protein
MVASSHRPVVPKRGGVISHVTDDRERRGAYR